MRHESLNKQGIALVKKNQLNDLFFTSNKLEDFSLIK